jgi:hypothetical protein
LFIGIANEQQADLVLTKLTKLESLNGQPADLLMQATPKVEPINDSHVSASTQIPKKQSEDITTYIDASELESIAACFDNIRRIRADLPANDDELLAEQFDMQLTSMMNKVGQSEDKRRAVLEGKRSMMVLLTEKLAEYLKHSDPACEGILREVATHYDIMVEQGMDMPRLKENPDAEIKRLREELRRAKSNE